MYTRVKGYIENLADYFPDYEYDYVPQGSILEYILNFKPGVNREFIDHAIKERNKQKVT